MISLYIKPQALLYNASLYLIIMSHVLVMHQFSMRFEPSFCYYKGAACFPISDSRIIMSPAAKWAGSPAGSYLPGTFGLVVVVVGGQVDVFMDAVQQPQEELQGVVLGVATKLWSILGHYSLERGKSTRDESVFFLQLHNYHCLVDLVHFISGEIGPALEQHWCEVTMMEPLHLLKLMNISVLSRWS